MAGRGRPPKPTAIKIAEGNPGKRPLNLHEPKPVQSTVILECPPNLSCEAAKAKWAQLSEMLHRIRVMTEADREPLAQLCEYLAIADECKAMMAKEGKFIISPRGGEVTAPWFLEWQKITRLCLPLFERFGMTPSSRSQISVTPEPQKNPFQDFLDQKNDFDDGKKRA